MNITFNSLAEWDASEVVVEHQIKFQQDLENLNLTFAQSD